MAIINDNHKNVLDSSLRIIEKDLRGIKQALGADGLGEDKAALYAVGDDVSVRARSGMLKIIKAMLEDIGEVKDKFGLETEIEPLSKKVSVRLSEIWVLLEDLRASKLKDYGSVSEAEKAMIEPRVLKMLKELDALEGILKDSKKAVK